MSGTATSQRLALLLGLWAPACAGGPLVPPPPDFILSATVAVPGAESLVLGDFDGDRVVDAVAGSVAAGTLAFLRGGGDGTLVPAGSPVAAPEAAALAAGDLDGDGLADVVVGQWSTGAIRILRGRAGAAPGLGPPLLLPGSATAAALADLDGDGDLDLVAALVPGKEFVEGSYAVALNSGAAAFTQHGAQPTDLLPGTVSLVDLDGDGRVDLIGTGDAPLLSKVSAGVTVSGGLGPGLFAPERIVPFDGRPTDHPSTNLVVDDVDGDGHLDAVTMIGGDTVGFGVFLGAPARAFSPLPLQPTPRNPGQLATADFDGDGRLDLALVYQDVDPEAQVTLWHGHGDGTFALRSAYRCGSPGAVLFAVATADLDSDGRPDLVVGDWRTQSVCVFLNRIP